MIQDHYSVLGVSKRASAKTIDKAFRKLAMRFHPDKADATPETVAKFKAVQTAFDVLSDPDRRAHYDATGQNCRRLEEHPDQVVNTLLANCMHTIIQQMLQNGKNPTQWNIVKAMQSSMADARNDLQKKYKSAEKTKQTLLDVAARFSPESGQANVLDLIAKAPLQELEEKCREFSKAIDYHEQALKILKRFNYKTDAAPSQQFTITGISGWQQFMGGSSSG